MSEPVIIPKRHDVIIVGAAGRDFHNFNLVYRDNSEVEVVAFTAAQIPDIAGRRYPPELAGNNYPAGIPIVPESELEGLVSARRKAGALVDVVFSYSDVAFDKVMVLASRALAAGASFRLLSPELTMLHTHLPVISVCAVRTGCGKSQTSREIASYLRHRGLRPVCIRHPMPYGDLAMQRVQRYGKLEDLTTHQCTIEEMEEYEPHIAAGGVVYAGVDYEAILRQAEEEADVIIWDGGNNDTSFVRSQRFLEVTVLDALRPGHETEFYPGMVNLLRADVLLINKVDAAAPEAIAQLRATCKQYNPSAKVILAESDLHLDHPELVTGKTVLAVEDGPSTTHGGLKTGAATVAATRHGAADVIDPRPYISGLPTLETTFNTYPSIGPLLPAMGYSDRQIRDLEAAIEKIPCDVVVVGTPIDLARVVKIGKPAVRVKYELSEAAKAELDAVIEAKLLVWEHGILH